MFIFVLLNLICLTIILAKFICYSENNRRDKNDILMKILGFPKTELDIIREDQDAEEELDNTCEHCNDVCNTDDDSSHDSMPELVEAHTKVSEEGEGEGESVIEEEEEEAKKEKEGDKSESDDVSIEHVSAQDLDVIKETIGFIQKTKEMLFEIKNDLEKKID
jgi:hypothetical protein